MSYCIKTRTGLFVKVGIKTLEDAENLVNEYEADDIKFCNYTKDFYEIIKCEKDHKQCQSN